MLIRIVYELISIYFACFNVNACFNPRLKTPTNKRKLSSVNRDYQEELPGLEPRTAENKCGVYNASVRRDRRPNDKENP